MNIDNSIGMALFSGESGAAAMSSQLGLANGTAESPEGSLFQQLINQMLTGKTQSIDAQTGNLNTGEKNKSGDMLAELIFAGRTLSNTGLQKTGTIIGETAETEGASGEKQAVGENSDAMEMLQAMMAGMTNTSAAASVEKALTGIQTEKHAESQIAINSVSTASGNQAAMEILKKTANNAVLQPGLNETTVPADGKTGLTEAAEGTTVALSRIRQIPEDQKQMSLTGIRSELTVLRNGKSAAENGIVTKESEETVLTNDKAKKPEAFAPQSILTPKAAIRNQPTVSETLTPEESAAPVEKTKQEIEAADETDLGRLGIQNSVQGAVTTGDITDADALAQPVQSPEPYSQIREEILSKLEQSGPTEFKMQLEPLDLGQIDIKLKLSEGKLVIDILAADSRTQALLTSQVDKLISSMGLQNVQVESVQVSQQMNSHTQGNTQNQGFTMNSAMDFSQQRQQEHNRQEILNNSKLAGTFSLQQDETKTNEAINRIRQIGFDAHRMNYSV